MRAYQIVGGNRLAGTVTAHGAKNAVLPILSAAVLCRRSVIENCPTLSDVAVSCLYVQHRFEIAENRFFYGLYLLRQAL